MDANTTRKSGWQRKDREKQKTTQHMNPTKTFHLTDLGISIRTSISTVCSTRIPTYYYIPSGDQLPDVALHS
jgi:hypothetical protein